MKCQKPKEGYMENPLRKVDRNIKCVCGSDKKVKKCCGRPYYVLIKWGEKVQEVIDTYNFKKKIQT